MAEKENDSLRKVVSVFPLLVILIFSLPAWGACTPPPQPRHTCCLCGACFHIMKAVPGQVVIVINALSENLLGVANMIPLQATTRAAEQRKWDEIRLLEPVLDACEDVLEFRIHNYKRVQAPPYTALSYTWSKEDKNCEILLDSLVFKVTRELKNCLEHLTRDTRKARRHTDSKKNTDRRVRSDPRLIPKWTHIWADSICINQEDEDEKNMQVSRMDRTYSEANQVSVWLGGTHSRPSKWYGHDVLKSLVPHRYWTRTWVIQEFLLGKDITIHCGTGRGDCIDLDTFTHFAKTAKRDGIIFQEPVKFADSLLRAKKDRGEAQPLWKLMRRHQLSSCQSPRDKVFALLSLMPPRERSLLQRYFPDYRLPLEMVIIITLVHIVHGESQTLDLACDAVFVAFDIKDARQQEYLKEIALYIPGEFYKRNTPRGDRLLYRDVWRRVRPNEWFISPGSDSNSSTAGMQVPDCIYINWERKRDEEEAKRQKNEIHEKIQKEARMRNAKLAGLTVGVAVVGRWFGWW
ncbi:heterokaryon incompatibility protein-domain-containing protein [Rhypophila decipiens]|uniref:Heterokaryon incompatibility protein-domain-containing protein n=1 Tax=Rhypophila decipiens TaxID=261697 RepID=A0AAN6Y1F4_9PEZI|nr:heterokaryon incompatibility protein-domain-containing protein [Rhypophila decipiens]